MSGETGRARWEYLTQAYQPGSFVGEAVNPALVETALNAAGQDGWELVRVVNVRGDRGQTVDLLMIFKRPLRDEDPRRPLGFQR